MVKKLFQSKGLFLLSSYDKEDLIFKFFDLLSIEIKWSIQHNTIRN